MSDGENCRDKPLVCAGKRRAAHHPGRPSQEAEASHSQTFSKAHPGLLVAMETLNSSSAIRRKRKQEREKEKGRESAELRRIWIECRLMLVENHSSPVAVCVNV